MRERKMKSQLFAILAATLFTATSGQAVTEFPLRINSGARDPIVDGNGITWQEDQYFTTGYYDNNNRCASNGPGPHCKIRSFNVARNPAPYGYGVPVENGEYLVTVHLIETHYTAPNERIMDVVSEGVTVGAGIDVAAITGWKLKPYSFNFTSTVTDGQLDVHVVSVLRNPMITGIEIDIPVVPTISPAPTDAPTTSMAPSMSPQPSAQPTGTPPPTPAPPFQPVLINCGGPDYTDILGNLWKADFGFQGGTVYADGSQDIEGTADDTLYQSERYGEPIYTLEIPPGNYQVVLHFAELYWNDPNKRIFNVEVEGADVNGIDVVARGGGSRTAFTIEIVAPVSDGELNIIFEGVKDWAKISAIEVNLVGPHLAHSVTSGPYIAVDVDNDGMATVVVDGSTSHTHGIDHQLVQWSWMEDGDLLASSAEATFDLPVGDHTVSLTVVDNEGNDSTDLAEVSVFPFGYPVVTDLNPSSGPISGGDTLTIMGVGFTYSSAETTVHFGDNAYTGSEITIINDSTITIVVPATTVATPIQVSVETPLGRSISGTYGYINGVPIDFDSGFLVNVDDPTVGRFGPDGKLYVGTGDGRLFKYELNADHTSVVNTVQSEVAAGRFVMGIAFDPMESNVSNPTAYISTSIFFHGEESSSFGAAINGDIRKVTGALLDSVETIISGLPVSDHDHGVNGLIFGDHGELYIQIGGNTNGGVPGQLSESQVQEENYFSAATLVAYLSDANFDGNLSYSSNNGAPVTGNGIEVFAAGLRNPYGICFHSNGHIYGTDNGPNKNYGDMMTGCGQGEQIPDVTEKDKLLLIEQGKYYGHPNPIRASVDNDERQCVWRSIQEPTDADHEAPLLITHSSTNGIIEWTTNHFFGQLRGNLILSKFSGGMYRVILEPDGRSVIAQSDPALNFGIGSKGLDVTQSPSGTLVEVRHEQNNLHFHKPKEPAFAELRVNCVFPLRGGQAGGGVLKVYGSNFGTGSQVTVGGVACPVIGSSDTLIECTLPGGVGKADVVVSNGSETDVFSEGYRYITGLPSVGTPAPTVSLTPNPTALVPTPTTLAPTMSPTTLAPTVSPTVSPTAPPSTSPAPTALFSLDGSWITVDNDAPINNRHEACFVMVGRKAYLIGGRGAKDTDVYDPASRNWSKGATPPMPDIHHMQCVAVDNKVYIVAAYTGNYPNEQAMDNVFVYDTVLDLWELKTALPLSRRRAAGAAVVVGRRIYLSHGSVGGHEDGSGNAEDTGWLDYYNVDTDTWVTNLPNAPNPRDHCGGALVNEAMICVAGGRRGGLVGWPSVLETDCFDLTTETWSIEMNIPQPRAGSAYGTTCDGKLIIAGGEGASKAWNNVDVFDGTSWTTIDGLVQARHGTGLAVDCACNQIHIASGSGKAGALPELKSIETYFPGGTDTVCPAIVTTASPVSTAPISLSPVSAAPTPAAPISSAPVTAAPSSLAPISSSPTSLAPSTQAPITAPPTSRNPTSTPVTLSPTSAALASDLPLPTLPPTVLATATQSPTTGAPVITPTLPPTTLAPVTQSPTTGAPVVSTLPPTAGSTLPWIESFDGLPNGSVADVGETSWTAVRGTGNFNVENGELVVNNGGDEGVFQTYPIDIGGLSVDISVQVYSVGGLEDYQDYVRLYAIVDGTEQLLGEVKGVQSTVTTIAGTGITGSTLVVVIRTYVSFGDEYYHIDNVRVDATGAAPTHIPTPAPTHSPIAPPTIPSPLSLDGTWELFPNQNVAARHEACFVMGDNGKAYLMGGRETKDVDIFDPSTRSWSKGTEAPQLLHHMQCVSLNGKIYLAAAWTAYYPEEENADDMWTYDTATDQWEALAAMPAYRRRGSAAVVVDGTKIWVSHGNRGGHEQADQNFATSYGWIDYYETATNTWVLGDQAGFPEAPNPRDHAGGGLVNGRICVAAGRDGGADSSWPAVAATDCYDPVSNTWTAEAAIPETRSGSSYGTSCDGKLIVAGGERNISDRVDVFDGSRWQTFTNGLADSRHGSGLAVDCIRNRIYIASGSPENGGGTTQSMEIYSP